MQFHVYQVTLIDQRFLVLIGRIRRDEKLLLVVVEQLLLAVVDELLNQIVPSNRDIKRS